MVEEKKSKKIGMFLDERTEDGISKEVQLSMLGYNTGNQMFFHALKSQLPIETLARNTSRIEELEEYSAFVTTDFVWIRENVDMSYMNKYIQLIGDKALVPISVGLQALEFKKNFKLHPETVSVLKQVEERCIMGVRGEYTAEILNRHGIHNIQIIGCPSLYQLEGGLKRKNKITLPRHVSVNFRSFGEKLSAKETEFLLYAAERKCSFVEQTEHVLERGHVSNNKNFDRISSWLEEHGELFLNLRDWRNYMQNIDFCIGSRFHGNVVALWEGVPALFLLTDSRTSELCSFFGLPCMEMKKFNCKKAILHYLLKADYTEFNKTFPEKKVRYEEFLRKNRLK